MNRIVYLELAENERYPMVFTLSAVRAVRDNWQDIPGLFKAVKAESQGLDFKSLLFCIETLVKQGCAYMNAFQHDMPTVPGIPLTKRGYYKPISAEEIAARLKVGQISTLIDLIVETYEKGAETTINGRLTAEARAQNAQQETSGELAWFDFQCRSFGIPYREYHLMTLGEIQDLAVCKAIQAGAMREEIDTPYLPDWK